jgi:hypothetical protein
MLIPRAGEHHGTVLRIQNIYVASHISLSLLCLQSEGYARRLYFRFDHSNA